MERSEALGAARKASSASRNSKFTIQSLLLLSSSLTPASQWLGWGPMSVGFAEPGMAWDLRCFHAELFRACSRSKWIPPAIHRPLCATYTACRQPGWVLACCGTSLGPRQCPREGDVVDLHGHVLENDVRLLLQVFLDRLLNRRFGMNPLNGCKRPNLPTPELQDSSLPRASEPPVFETTLPHAALDCQKKEAHPAFAWVTPVG